LEFDVGTHDYCEYQIENEVRAKEDNDQIKDSALIYETGILQIKQLFGPIF